MKNSKKQTKTNLDYIYAVKTIEQFMKQTCILAVLTWYFLSSTNIIYKAMDVILPASKIVENLGFPCALHNCNCTTAEQCLNNCCCFPKEPQPPICSSCASEKPQTGGKVTVKVDYFEASKCSRLTLQEHLSEPHTPIIPTLNTPDEICIGEIDVASAQVLISESKVTEKIPI